MKNQHPLFKSHLLQSDPYVGGSTRSEASGEHSVLYKMSSNENPLGPSPLALDAIRDWLGGVSEYNFQSDEMLLNALAEDFGNGFLPGQFLPANSGMELLDIVCRAFLEPGDKCIICTPAFMAYKNFSALSGATVIDVPLKQPDFMLDVEGILESIDRDTRIIFLANPNNPTGTLFSSRDIKKLVDALPAWTILVYDEVYHHFVEEPDYPRAADFIREGKNVIGIHSFSKAYGLAGLRLGYLFSTPEMAAYLRRLRRPFMINTLSVVAGMAALRDKEHLEKTENLIAQEKRWLYRKFDSMGIRYWKSQANFILLVPPINPESFLKKTLEAGIMIRSGNPMGAPGTVRVTIGTHEMNEYLCQVLFQISAPVNCAK